MALTTFTPGPCAFTQTKVVIPSFSRKSHMRKHLHGNRMQIASTDGVHNFRYEVLSDSQKRGLYDSRGEAGLSEGGMGGGMDAAVSSRFLRGNYWCIECFVLRTCSLNYLVEVEVEVSLAAPVVVAAARVKARISSTKSLCLWKNFTGVKLPSLH